MITFKNSLYTLLLSSITLTALTTGPAYAVNTAQIVANTANAQCMEWSVVGTCFWLKCSPKCKVRTSVKVKHYIPEVVVSSYTNTGANPWTEMALLGSSKPGAEDGGNLITPNQKRGNLPRFKNTDVIGHPASYVLNQLSSYTCSSATTGFMPYYLSTLDVPSWRWGVTEMLYPQSIIPGQREIQKGMNGWGSVYPRQGFLVQGDDGKAGAVLAQRAADFVVRTGQPHVYKSIFARKQESRGWWPPGAYEDPLIEGNKKTHKWQQLHPSVSSSCEVWPTSDQVEQDAQGGYAYALWRPYRCCEPKGTFLYSIGQ